MEPALIALGIGSAGALSAAAKVAVANYKSHDRELRAKQEMDWWLSDKDLTAPIRPTDWEIFEREIEMQLDGDPWRDIDHRDILYRLERDMKIAERNEDLAKRWARNDAWACPSCRHRFSAPMDPCPLCDAPLDEAKTFADKKPVELKDPGWKNTHNCPRCGFIFTGFGNGNCPACNAKLVVVGEFGPEWIIPTIQNERLVCDTCGHEFSPRVIDAGHEHSFCGGRAAWVKYVGLMNDKHVYMHEQTGTLCIFADGRAVRYEDPDDTRARMSSTKTGNTNIDMRGKLW